MEPSEATDLQTRYQSTSCLARTQGVIPEGIVCTVVSFMTCLDWLPWNFGSGKLRRGKLRRGTHDQAPAKAAVEPS